MLGPSLHRVVAFTLLAASFYRIASQDAGSSLDTDALLALPACGLQCIAEKAPEIGCELLDIECQCSSTNSTSILQPCLEASCTYEEIFSILRAQASICRKPHDSRSNGIRVTAYLSGIVPIIAVSMRFASRILGRNELWWDDWLHLTSVILVIPMTVLLLLNVESGIGRHLWDLTYPQVTDIGRYTYIASIFWGFELLILKYSILCLYLRIFPNVWLKRGVFAFMIFTALFTVPLIGLAVFQCIPVHAIWDLEEQSTAKCIDWITVLRLTVVYEVIAEIILFSLPLPIVATLQMKLARKVQLMVFFGMGICVIGVSIARVPFLKGVVDKSDQTYTVAMSSILGFAASGIGHVCAAVPTVRAFVRYCMNGFKLDSQVASSNNDKTYESRTKQSYKSSGNGSGNKSAAGPPSLFADDEGGDDGNVELHVVVRSPSASTDKRASIQRVSGLGYGDSSSDKDLLVEETFYK